LYGHTTSKRYSTINSISPLIEIITIIITIIIRRRRRRKSSMKKKNEIIKYSNLPNNLIFQPIAGVFSSSSSDFISALGHKIISVCVWRRKRNFILVLASVCGIATIQCSSSALHLRSPGRSRPIAIPALFLLLLTLGNYKPKSIEQEENFKKIIIIQKLKTRAWSEKIESEVRAVTR